MTQSRRARCAGFSVGDSEIAVDSADVQGETARPDRRTGPENTGILRGGLVQFSAWESAGREGA